MTETHTRRRRHAPHMGFGDTARKLQSVADTAEDVYRKLTELREQVVEMRESVEDVERRTDRLEAEIAEQRALLDALARELDVDVEETVAGAHIGEAERAPEERETEATDTGDASDAP